MKLWWINVYIYKIIVGNVLICEILEKKNLIPFSYGFRQKNKIKLER
jgi:hypothetical protein